jgi:hypothetical protein
MNYYLRTADEATLWAFLESVNLAVKDYDAEDPLNQPPKEPAEDWTPTGAFDWRFTGESLDIIGAIYRPTGNVLIDSEGFEVPEMAPIEGFHANLIAPVGLQGDAIIQEPNQPYRVWAGMLKESLSNSE